MAKINTFVTRLPARRFCNNSNNQWRAGGGGAVAKSTEAV